MVISPWVSSTRTGRVQPSPSFFYADTGGEGWTLLFTFFRRGHHDWGGPGPPLTFFQHGEGGHDPPLLFSAQTREGRTLPWRSESNGGGFGPIPPVFDANGGGLTHLCPFWTQTGRVRPSPVLFWHEQDREGHRQQVQRCARLFGVQYLTPSLYTVIARLIFY